MIPASKLDQINKLIDKSKRILIICHRNPDGDTLGSMLAFFLVLSLQLGKKVQLFCQDPVPEKFYFLPSFFEVKNKLDLEKEEFDLLITVDTATQSLLGGDDFVKWVFNGNKKVLNIDHHHDNALFGDLNLMLNISSTSEMIFHLIEKLNLKITPQIATCLLTGIYTDTGGLQHDNATEDTFLAASKLMFKGARLNLISDHVFHYKPLPGLRLWGRALSRIKHNQEKGINVSIITQKDIEECGATQNDLEGIINVINSIPNSKATILLSENDGSEIKGSIRTELDNIDVSKIASLFGGGGHKKASGFSIPGKLERTGGGGWKIVR